MYCEQSLQEYRFVVLQQTTGTPALQRRQCCHIFYKLFIRHAITLSVVPTSVAGCTRKLVQEYASRVRNELLPRL